MIFTYLSQYKSIQKHEENHESALSPLFQFYDLFDHNMEEQNKDKLE